MASVFRSARHAGVRLGCRQFFRRRANVDRARENRDGNDAVDPDLPAEPVHFHLPGWNRCAACEPSRGVLFAAVGLGALLLIGFAPVAWIFSQSTDSVAFMAALHIGLWAIGIMFGLRLLEAMGHLLGGSARNHLKFWGVIFIVVCLQMMTTLRPIVGTSEHFLPSEKKFFLAHWAETLGMRSAENDPNFMATADLSYSFYVPGYLC